MGEHNKTPNPTKKKNSDNKWLHVIGIVIVLLVICVILRVMTAKDGVTKQTNVRFLMEHVKSGDMLTWKYSRTHWFEFIITFFCGSLWTHSVLIQMHRGVPHTLFMQPASGERTFLIRVPLQEWLITSHDGKRPGGFYRLAYSEASTTLTQAQEDELEATVEHLRHDRAIRLRTRTDMLATLDQTTPYDPAVEAKATFRRMTCSEVVAFILRRMGRMSVDPATSKMSAAYHPHHIVIEHRDLIPGSYHEAVEIK